MVRLRNVKLTVALVLHEHCHKLVTDLWSVLCVISQAVLFLLHAVSKLRFFVKL